MKKIVIVFFIMILFISVLWSEEIPNKNYKKIIEIFASKDTADIGYYFANLKDENGEPIPEGYFANNKKVYFINGFDFKNYDVNDPNLSEIRAAAMNAIINGKEVVDEEGKTREISKAETSYSILGYSQGGLTALGYLTALERDYPSKPYRDPKDSVPAPEVLAPIDKIDSVITISGALLGAPILANNLNIRVHQKVGILSRGIGAFFAVFNPRTTLGPFGFLEEMGFSTLLGVAIIEIFWAVDPSFLQPFYKRVWKNPSLEGMEQLRDMKPGSDYIKNNVAETEPVIYMAETGKKVLITEWRYKISSRGRKIWYLWTGRVNEKVPKIAMEQKPKFDPNVPVGFIAGVENRPLRMGGKDGNSDKDNKAYDVAKGFKIGFAVVEGIHIARCIGIVGLFTGSRLYAASADRARRFCRNIDTEISEVIGSTDKGDGFIPLANQHIPASFENPRTKVKTKHLNNVLSNPLGDGYLRIKETHYSIDKKGEKYTDEGKLKYIRNPDTYSKAAEMALKGFYIRRDQGLRNNEK